LVDERGDVARGRVSTPRWWVAALAAIALAALLNSLRQQPPWRRHERRVSKEISAEVRRRKAAPGTSTVGKSIPGPKGYPLLGSIPDIQRDNIQTFMDAWRTYGDAVHFSGPLDINLLVHPDYVKRVLQDNHKNYPRPEFVQEKLQSIVGDGLVAGEGSSWLRSRRLTQPSFHRETVAGVASTFGETTGRILDQWLAKLASGRPLDVKSEMMHVSLANLASALFKTDWSGDIDRVEPMVAYLLAHTNRRLTSPVDPQKLPLPSSWEFDSNLRTLDDILHQLIRERREQPGTDMVSMLLATKDEDTGQTMTDLQVRDEVSGFFIAGHETVSSALTWTWYLLSKNPDCWRRVREEVEDVLGGREPTAADVARLRYTTMVLQEAMRLYPPIFVLMRFAVDDDAMGEYRVPAQSNVVLCPYVTHRHPAFWEDPEGFDPERFAPERSAGRHRMAYFPFAGGPRKCIGDSFAMMQMPIVVAMIAQRYRMDLAPGAPVVPQPAISLRPRDPLLMTVCPAPSHRPREPLPGRAA
jgi:cytochrome P450